MNKYMFPIILLIIQILLLTGLAGLIGYSLNEKRWINRLQVINDNTDKELKKVKEEDPMSVGVLKGRIDVMQEILDLW